jgi:hypothetical protein
MNNPRWAHKLTKVIPTKNGIPTIIAIVDFCTNLIIVLKYNHYDLIGTLLRQLDSCSK